MSEVKLAAVARTEFGKGAARRTRRANQIPAVLYGHGGAVVHIALPGHETTLALKQANALFSIDLDGKVQLAVAKDIQRDPVKNVIEHIDLLVVRRGEKINVEVNIHVVGESAPGTIHVVETQAVTLEAEATHLPQFVEVDVQGLEAGTQIHGSDLVLPEGSVLVGDPEQTIVTIS
ncbi:MAG TPA: 50S ribosomal protein L25/general stress protein Ctc, partial [Actinotalea sp.]